MAIKDADIVTDAIRMTLPPFERVIPNGARLSVVRHVAKLGFMVHRASVLDRDAKRTVQNERAGHYPRRFHFSRAIQHATLTRITAYLELTPDELFAATAIAHSNHMKTPS